MVVYVLGRELECEPSTHLTKAMVFMLTKAMVFMLTKAMVSMLTKLMAFRLTKLMVFMFTRVLLHTLFNRVRVNPNS